MDNVPELPISRRRALLVACALLAVLLLAASLVVRSAWPGIACAAGLAAASSAFVRPERAGLLVACSAVLAGAWWGSMRLAVLDRSLLAARIGWAETSLVTVTGPPRRGRFELRLPARVSRFGLLQIDEPVLLELPRGRAPPLGARLEVLGELVRPRGSSHGFDESRWLRRQGVHVVLRGDRWRIVGRRGGLPGFADRLRGWLGRSAARGLTGERRGIVEGVVLGDDAGLSDELRRDFRASGLYHLLAVSGQNVALVAGSALLLAWLLGVPRLLGEIGALAAIGAYVLAVGAQPSVVRAAVAGALGSLAWITARQKDRWHFLLLGARRRAARRRRPPRRRLCLAPVPPELKPVYLITGSDHPKVARAVRRLRDRVGREAAETLSAAESSGEDAVGACNALGLFGEGTRLVVVEEVERWRAAAVKEVTGYLGNPAPGTVLALVGDGIKADAPLAKACAKAGDVLRYEAPRKRDLPSWVVDQLTRRSARADPDACRALAELVGDDLEALAAEVEKLATWAGGETIGVSDVELLAIPRAEASVFALTDAWGRRDLAAVLRACDALLERSQREPTSTAARRRRVKVLTVDR